ncbi:unnamed protein product, partial [Didymodactylos carnosus]
DNHNFLKSKANDARSVLCPIVGYYGSFCPGSTRKLPSSVKNDEIPKLPVGVGTTIDLSTGKLMLPAFNLTYHARKKWIDPKSQQTYIIPDEIELTDVPDNNENNNIPRINIYQNV